MYLDRRVPSDLIDVFAENGSLLFIRDRVKSHPDLDLQFRHDPKRPADSRATVYCGGTKILEVLFLRNGFFRLDANRECRAAAPYLPDWDAPRSSAQFSVERSAIEAYLDLVVETVHPGRWLKEGQVETRLVSMAQSFAPIDRQTRFGFSNRAERQQVLGALCSQFADHLDRAKTSSEADVLAIDSKARLLVIEVKHESALDVMTSPAQACFDSTLVRLWRSEKSRAAEILNGMLEQRVRLRLSPDPGVRLGGEFEIVPIAAIGPIEGPTALPAGIFTERDRLLAGSLAPDGLEIWSVGENGSVVTIAA